ncbi:MAG: PQQ-binding-like beta-propeller repeat protein [Pirellulales bacterium]|jgi:outer membrane protein assembly factor BamB
MIRLWILLLICTVTTQLKADDWPQWRGVNRDGVWHEKGIVSKFEDEQLEPVWRMPIGSGYSGPTVADGYVYITDRLVDPKQVERVHCFDSKSGTKIWSHEYDCPYVGVGYDAGPRASVTIDDKCAYSIGAMGNLYCFDATSGTILWKRDLNKDFKIQMPGWGIAASPLIYKDTVILIISGKNGACVVGLDKKSGENQWKALNDRAGYAAPILVEQAGKPVVLCWTGDSVAGLNPKNGKVYWRFPWAPNRMPIGIATPTVSNNRVFFTSFYDGSLMLGLKQDEIGYEKLWQVSGADEKNTLALHSIISTPVFEQNHIYGADSYGELRCLDANYGTRIWEDQTATPRARWSNIHFVKNGDRYFLFNERGELIIAKLSPAGFDEIDRAKLIEPTQDQLRSRRGGVCWAHPAYADKHVFARNDKEILCVNLEKD